MKIFDSIKQNYNHLFKSTTLLTNFLRKCHQDFTVEVIGEHQDYFIEYEWDGDY
jgi:hypothetical protein